MKETTSNLIDDFLEAKYDIIIHGCNCHHAMASGIAAEISQRLPEAKMADLIQSHSGDVEKLSNYTSAFVRRKNNTIGTVINLYTQYLPGKDLYEEALLLGFKKLSKVITKDIRIGIPQIGCGIAGGDWKVIGPKIANIMKEHDITLVKFIGKTKVSVLKIEKNEE